MSDLKAGSADVWAKVAPVLDERLKKYVKKGGEIQTAEDPALKALIDKKLADYDQK